MYFIYLSIRVGEILCRISDHTAEIREIGILLQDGQFGSPGFVIQEHSKELRYFGLTFEIVDDMIFNLHFQMPKIQLRVSSKTPSINMKIRFEKSEDYSISGFPRTFKEDQRKASRKSSPLEFSTQLWLTHPQKNPAAATLMMHQQSTAARNGSHPTAAATPLTLGPQSAVSAHVLSPRLSAALQPPSLLPAN